MERHYVIFVEFTPVLEGRAAVTQTIEVHSAGAEFSVLLQALNASSDVASLRVCTRSSLGRLNVVTRTDLGLPLITKIK